MATSITIDQKVKFELGTLTDRAGNPAAIDGVPEWTLDGVDEATVEAAADGMSAYVISGDAVDEAGLLKCTMDADLGDGVESLILTEEIQVTGGNARFGTLTASAPEPKDIA